MKKTKTDKQVLQVSSHQGSQLDPADARCGAKHYAQNSGAVVVEWSRALVIHGGGPRFEPRSRRYFFDLIVIRELPLRPRYRVDESITSA